MFYDFIYLVKGFRMRPKVRSTLSRKINYDKCRTKFNSATQIISHIPVVRIRILIGTTVVRIRILIRTTVVRIASAIVRHVSPQNRFFFWWVCFMVWLRYIVKKRNCQPDRLTSNFANIWHQRYKITYSNIKPNINKLLSGQTFWKWLRLYARPSCR